MKPTIGRIVIYRTDGRNGLAYDLPAIITCTEETHPGDYPDGQQNPLPAPQSAEHVHLTVFTPGGFGTKIGEPGYEGIEPMNDREFKGAPGLVPGSGTYVEWNVPMNDPDDEDDPQPRTWRWPVIVR